MAVGAVEPILSGGNPLLDPIALLIVQVLIIVCTSRLLAWPLGYFKQPKVIAEVLGGIILGNSGLSRIPAFKEAIFPSSSLPGLKLIAEFGLIFFLFIVGLEMDLSKMLGNANKTIVISIAGIVLPFSVGVGASKVLYDVLMGESTVPFASFLLFTGVAMSITAFPVLCSILVDKKLLKTEVGGTTLSAAAVDDMIAWTLLLIVLALIRNSGNYIVALWCFLTAVAWALLLYFVVRPLLIKLVALRSEEDHIPQFSVFLVFVVVLVSSFMTNAIGIHAIFGAFLAGLIMPHEFGFAVKLTEKLEDLISIIFLPLYFAFSGLNTRIDLLNTGTAWGMVVLVITVACFGKIVGCGVAAKFSGLSTRESFAVGVLMNTKGLVELIVLNIGLSNGVINESVFTVMVVMALFTTFLTVPVLNLIYPERFYLKKSGKTSQLKSPSNYTLREDNLPLVARFATNESYDLDVKIMLCLPSMHSVPSMMSLTQIIQATPIEMSLHALRLIPLGDRNSTIIMATETESTMRTDPALNIFKTFGELNRIGVHPMLSVCPSHDFADNILNASDEIGANMIILPWNPHSGTSQPLEEEHQGILSKVDQTHKRVLVEAVCQKATCTVVVFVDRGFSIGASSSADEEQLTTRSRRSAIIAAASEAPQRILVPFVGGPDDREALLFALYMTHSKGVKVTVLVIADTDLDKNKASEDEGLAKANSAGTLDPCMFDEDAKLLYHVRQESALDIQDIVSDDPIEAIKSHVLSEGLLKNELVIVGKSIYDDGLDQFMDNECLASGCVIQRSKVRSAMEI